MRKSGCRGLKSSTNHHDCSAKHDHALPTESVRDEDTDDGAEETAQVVAGDGDALRLGSLRLERCVPRNGCVVGVDRGEDV